jgi:integrase
MPKRIRKVDDTYAGQDVVRQLFQAARKRDRIIVRIFVSCGLRPQETFARRGNDIERGRLRVDEALKQAERGAAFIGEPKSRRFLRIRLAPCEAGAEWRAWIRDESIPPEGWLFPAGRGCGPIRPNNYVKRDLAKVGRGRRCRADRSQAAAPHMRDLPSVTRQLPRANFGTPASKPRSGTT